MMAPYFRNRDTAMDNDDNNIFRNAMGDVKPLTPDNRVRLQSKAQPSIAQLERRRTAQGISPLDKNPLTIPDELDDVGPHDIIGWNDNVIHEEVYRKLRLWR